MEHSEPALLIGGTGIGKTTLCQMLAFMRGQELHVLSCNRNTEAADLLGGYRPARRRDTFVDSFREAFLEASGCATVPSPSHVLFLLWTMWVSFPLFILNHVGIIQVSATLPPIMGQISMLPPQI
jgi:energy-coupling factor transporter ATP-binding protein EcfA2